MAVTHKAIYLAGSDVCFGIGILKVQSCKWKKQGQMIAYVFRKYPENFAVQLFIILQ